MAAIKPATSGAGTLSCCKEAKNLSCSGVSRTPGTAGAWVVGCGGNIGITGHLLGVDAEWLVVMMTPAWQGDQKTRMTLVGAQEGMMWLPVEEHLLVVAVVATIVQG
jgi:hypothetical protein